MKLFFYCLFAVLLSSCSLYHRIFHPYRIPTPKPSLEFKEQLAAQKKAKPKTSVFSGFKKKRDEQEGAEETIKTKPGAPAPEAVTDVATPTGGPPQAAGAASTPQARTLPEKSTVRYDKNGIMKNPRLIRRRLHKPGWSFRPWQSIRNFFTFRFHGKPNYSPDHKPAVPSPAPLPDVAPGTAPDEPPTEPKPAGAPAAKPNALPKPRAPAPATPESRRAPSIAPDSAAKPRARSRGSRKVDTVPKSETTP